MKRIATVLALFAAPLFAQIVSPETPLSPPLFSAAGQMPSNPAVATDGDMVTIRVHPVDPRLDPAFSFYTGFTTADTSQFSNFSDWGGLTFIDFGATLTPGGGEDAVWSFAPQTHALYTIAVGGWDSAGCPSGCSSAFGPYPYLVTVTGNTGNTPEPMTLALFGIGIAGVAFARRKSFNDLRRAS